MVVFAIAGSIELLEAINITNPDVVVDGSGAPVTITTDGRGFTPIVIKANNVTLRNLRIRPKIDQGSVGDGTDGITIMDADNVLIDHCSVSWGVDENISIVRSKGVTVRDCIISEGLYDSMHSEGPHSCGLLIADTDCEATVIRCLFAHNDYRNPVSDGRSDVVNNVIYAPGIGGTHYNDQYGPSHNNYIGNVLRFSQSQTPEAVNWVRTWGLDAVRVYREDNLADGLAESFYVRPNIEGMPTDLAHYLVDTPYPMLYTGEIMPAAEVLDFVLENAGASPRDATDARIVSQVTNRTGGLVDAPPA